MSVDYHAYTHRRFERGGTDPLQLEVWRDIAVFAPRGALDGNLPETAIVVSTGDGKAWFEVSEEEDGYTLVAARAAVSVAGAVEIQLRNETQSTDLLTTPITIDTGETSSRTATPAVIDTTVILAAGDQIFIDVDDADAIAEGLIVTVATALV